MGSMQTKGVYDDSGRLSIRSKLKLAAYAFAGSYEGTHAGQARERGNLGHGSRNFEIKERSSHALLGLSHYT